jgi:two-component system C4-dicarboxylate transport sensor histidine kinase DctB
MSPPSLEALPTTSTPRADSRIPEAQSGRKPARPRLRLAWVGLATLLLALPVMLLSHRVSQQQGMERLFEVAAERMELYAGALESEVRRMDPLPALVALDEDVTALFEAPSDLSRRERASRKLARLSARAGSQLIFATDADGRMLASSEGVAPANATQLLRVAKELRVRGRGFFAATAAVAGTDYYHAEPVERATQVLGWLVVRVNLAPLEATWVDLGVRSSSERLLVVDEHDVVIMSSVPAWKYRTLNDVAEHWQADLQASGRYPAGPLKSLGLHKADTTLFGAPLVQVTQGGEREAYVSQERTVAQLALRFVALSDPDDVLANARGAALGAGALVALAGLLVLYLLHRRRVLKLLFKARNDLQRARDQLEHQVALRTAELQGTNAELERQIAQRQQSEQELIQAGKLAVLGQLSAGIAHELNQPLTALRALAGNSLRLLQAGRSEALASNLGAIGDVTERMGRITSQLKTFARRQVEQAQDVSIAVAIANARMLIEHRLVAECVSCEVEAPAGLRVRADGTRLEQVLLNLMGNSLDAMHGRAERRLRVQCDDIGERVRVRISDTGCGMDEAAFGRLFEPFFTTKPAGEGLGLGLVISSKIVREFGGTLQARRGAHGMIFEFEIDHAKGPPPDV